MAPKLYMINVCPPARAVLMLAKALDIELELVETNIFEQAQLTDNYLKLNPQHTIPTLVDDGHCIWDSHAINLYLIEKSGKETHLYPKDIYTRAKIHQRLFFEAELVFQLMRSICTPIFGQLRTDIPEEKIEKAEEVYAFLEKFLENDKWMVGNEDTLADLTMIASVTGLEVFVPINEKYTKLHDWMDRIKKLSYYSANIQGLSAFRARANQCMCKSE